MRKSPHNVTFGVVSYVDRISVSCFDGTHIRNVSIPERVLELCDRCCYHCRQLRSLTFGCSSPLDGIGVEASSGEEDARKGATTRTVCHVKLFKQIRLQVLVNWLTGASATVNVA